MARNQFFPGELTPVCAETFTRRYVHVDGVRLHFVHGGPDDGPLVVLLHGWPQTWSAWRRVMPSLVEVGLRVVAVDHRGAGDSDRPFQGFEKAAMADGIRPSSTAWAVLLSRSSAATSAGRQRRRCPSRRGCTGR